MNFKNMRVIAGVQRVQTCTRTTVLDHIITTELGFGRRRPSAAAPEDTVVLWV